VHTARLAVVAYVAIAALLIAALLAVGWYYSNQIIRPGPYGAVDEVAVAAADDSTVTLPRTMHTAAARVWFLEWPRGAATIDSIVAVNDSLVRRRVRIVEGRLMRGTRVAMRAFPYAGDPRRSMGIRFESVGIMTPGGDCPAWLVPGARGDWVILVHGMNASRGEALRVLPSIVRLGFPALMITYRGDRDAHEAPDRLHHLGATEWQDLDAAVAFARDNGARRVILYGFSMGGSIVANFLNHDPDRATVAGVVLDAPVLDWDQVVRQAARVRQVPQFVATIAEWLVSVRTGFDWYGFQGRIRSYPFRMPVLIYHGAADETVPIATSTALARELRHSVKFVVTPGAGHAQSWNYDPRRYESALERWLERVTSDSAQAALAR
jgi:uncharacterized protein